MKTFKTIEERFFNFVNKQRNGCWIWVGFKGYKDYGRFNYNGKILLAHRVSYLLFKGEIPKGLYICHTCDNSSCVNPTHLFAGTQKQNIMDMMKKGRGCVGEKSSFAKLNWSKVKEIREFCIGTNLSQRAIAKRFGISQPTVYRIINNINWVI